MPHFDRRSLSFAISVMAVLSLAGACGRSEPPAPGGAGAGRGGPPPAMPVEVITLAAKPIEQATEYVSTIKSRHSITIQPQVEGFLTRIAVASGAQVSPGTVLFEIDATSQQAAVAALESTRAAREADAEFIRQQALRAKSLFDVGAGSKQEAEQAAAAQKAAEAGLKALDEQIRQQRNELRYYRVTAPTAGVVGDIPVRQGDRVTRATALTTIDDRGGLELYIGVPVQQAGLLKPGLEVRLLGDAGQVIATERIAFVSPQVDTQTQTVLAKAAVTDRTRAWRTDQMVRTQVVWKTEPGLTVPIVAVIRINGQHFVFAAERTPQGLVARQKAVTLGPIAGNDYVLLSGLSAGDTLIVSGVQKIGDGMPVMAGGPAKKGRLEAPASGSEVPGFRSSEVLVLGPERRSFGTPEPRNPGTSEPGGSW